MTGRHGALLGCGLLGAVLIAAGVVTSTLAGGTTAGSSLDNGPTEPEPGSNRGPVAREELRAAAISQCEMVLDELDWREASGELDETELEEVELPEEEFERLDVPPPAFDGSVVLPDRRPSFDGFADTLDVTAIPDRELISAADACYDRGLLFEVDDAADPDPGEE